MEEKLKKLAENEEFTQKLEQTESVEDAVALFAEYGVEVTKDDLKAMLVTVPEGEMDEAALENVAGGRIGIRTPTLNPFGYNFLKWLKKLFT